MTATLQYLDPALIDISRYSGRNQSVFRSARFASLRRSIAHGAGNAIPVFARPEVDDRYTLGYGMLRLQACRELGLPVLTIVETVDEVSFFVRGQLENNADSMSAYERGTAYVRALNSGLFASLRKLAQATNVELSDVLACVRLVDLPTEVIEAFPRVIDIKATWSKKLTTAKERDPIGLIERAKQLRLQSATAPAVYAALTRASV